MPDICLYYLLPNFFLLALENFKKKNNQGNKINQQLCCDVSSILYPFPLNSLILIWEREKKNHAHTSQGSDTLSCLPPVAVLPWQPLPNIRRRLVRYLRVSIRDYMLRIRCYGHKRRVLNIKVAQKSIQFQVPTDSQHCEASLCFCNPS